MKLDGGVVVLICVIELSHGAQWVADHENITVCYNTDPCPLFDWRYTSDTAVQLIRWQYQAPGNNIITIMAATDDNGEPSFVEDGYKGRLFRDNSSQAAMRFCQMQESERVGTYSVEVVLVGTGLLGTGFVEEIMECADTSTTVSSQNPCPRCTGDILPLSSVSAMTLVAGGSTENRDTATTNTLSRHIQSVTTADVNYTDSKLAIWHIVLITVAGVLFLTFSVVVIITCLHKTDKNNVNTSFSGHNQYHKPFLDNYYYPSGKHARIPQHYTITAYPDLSHTNTKQPQPVGQSTSYYYMRSTDPVLLVGEGPHSVINISSKHDTRYPFSNITTRYIGCSAHRFSPNCSAMYEPRPDYDF